MRIKNRPLVRWAGSKTRLLDVLASCCPGEFDRYIEPFCGSMSLFLRLMPKQAVMADINWDLINFYKCVKRSPLLISEGVHSIPREESEYYRIRSLDTVNMDDLERAIRFFFLNRHCFNGVYRTNKMGKFNVPFGSKLSEVPSREEILEFSSKVQGVEFVNCDFEKVIERSGSGDFVYLDPPYAGTDSRNRGEYGPSSFKKVDIERLSISLEAASCRGAKILLSYASIPLIKERFSGWRVNEISVERSVSGFAKGRKKVPEVVITNY